MNKHIMDVLDRRLRHKRNIGIRHVLREGKEVVNKMETIGITLQGKQGKPLQCSRSWAHRWLTVKQGWRAHRTYEEPSSTRNCPSAISIISSYNSSVFSHSLCSLPRSDTHEMVNILLGEFRISVVTNYSNYLNSYNQIVHSGHFHEGAKQMLCLLP